MVRDFELWEIVKRRVTPLGQPVDGRCFHMMEEVHLFTTLDLHGFTTQQAHQITLGFLDSRKGTVTVITGKSGDICKEFPTWAALHPKVRSCQQMNGGGAFLIKLR